MLAFGVRVREKSRVPLDQAVNVVMVIGNKQRLSILLCVTQQPTLSFLSFLCVSHAFRQSGLERERSKSRYQQQLTKGPQNTWFHLRLHAAVCCSESNCVFWPVCWPLHEWEEWMWAYQSPKGQAKSRRKALQSHHLFPHTDLGGQPTPKPL